MSDERSADEVVYQSALQLWAAAQTDFDPYEVPPEEWSPAVPIRDADIVVDTHLDLEVVRESLRRLDGDRLVLAEEAGTVSVASLVSEGGAP